MIKVLLDQLTITRHSCDSCCFYPAVLILQCSRPVLLQNQALIQLLGSHWDGGDYQKPKLNFILGHLSYFIQCWNATNTSNAWVDNTNVLPLPFLSVVHLLQWKAENQIK